MTPRDVAALDLAAALGLISTTTAPLVAGQNVERSVLDVVAFHLSRCRARIDDLSGRGRHHDIGFATVSADWREAWRPASGDGGATNGPNGVTGGSYPMAILDGEVRRELFSMNERPMPDPEAPGVDWISPDGQWGMWHRGEEEGEARVIVYANYQPQAHALQMAVERALRGGAGGGPATFPLPEASLPTPFQGYLPSALYPKCIVEVLLPSSAPASDMADGAREGCWRVDIRFAWRADAFLARPRAPDYDPRFAVTTTEPSP